MKTIIDILILVIFSIIIIKIMIYDYQEFNKKKENGSMRVLVQTAPSEYKVLEIIDITYESNFFIMHDEKRIAYNDDTSGLVFLTADNNCIAIPGVTLDDANKICEQICTTGYANLSEYEVCIDVTHVS